MSKYTKEQRREYDLARYYKVRSRIFEYLGGKCVECGTANDLHVHHIDPKIKSFNVSDAWGRPWDDMTKELDKCELRCERHHIEVHSLTSCKHGTISGYRNKRCRCDACRLAWNEAQKKWSKTYKDKKRLGVTKSLERCL